MPNKLFRRDEIMTLIAYEEAFIERLIINHNSQHVADALMLNNARKEYEDYLMELFGEKE